MTFKNKTAVCEGYSRLFIQMLLFVGITDIEYQTGHTINDNNVKYNEKGKKIGGHAWVRVGYKYYDPTWDGENYEKKNKKSRKDIKYFAMPKDIFFHDRFLNNSYEKGFFKKPLEKRKKITNEKLYNVYEKYEKSGNIEILELPIFDEVKARKYIGIGPNEEVTLEIIQKKLGNIDFSGKKVYGNKYLNTYDIRYDFKEGENNIGLIKKILNNKNKEYIGAWLTIDGKKGYFLLENPKIEKLLNIEDLKKKIPFYEIKGDRWLIEGSNEILMDYGRYWYNLNERGKINSILKGKDIEDYVLVFIKGEYRLAMKKNLKVEKLITIEDLKKEVKIFYKIEGTRNINGYWKIDGVKNKLLSGYGENYIINSNDIGKVNRLRRTLKNNEEMFSDYTLLFIEGKYRLIKSEKVYFENI